MAPALADRGLRGEKPDGREIAEADAATCGRRGEPAGLVGQDESFAGIALELGDGAEGAEIPLRTLRPQLLADEAGDVALGHEAVSSLRGIGRQGRA